VVAASLSRQVSWLCLGYGGRTLAFLGLNVLLAQRLGPEQYGAVSLFLAVGAAIAYLAGAWPFQAVPMLVAEGRGVGETFRAAALAALAGAVVLTAGALPLAGALLGGEPGLLVLVLVYASAQLALQGAYSVLQTLGRARAIAAVQTGERVLALAVVAVIAATAGLGDREAQLALAVSAVVAAVIVLVPLARRAGLLRRSGTPAVRPGTIGRTVGLLAVVTTGSYVVAWVDLLLLGAFRSDAEVGHYALAYQVMTLVLQLGSLWIVVALPEYARRRARDPAATEQLPPPAQLAAAARLWSAGVAGVAVASALLLTTVFGAGFAASMGPLVVLLAGACVLAGYFAAVPVLMAQRRLRALATVTVGAIVTNVGLDLVLIPAVGAWGAAVATTAQTLAVTAAVLWLAAGPRAVLTQLGAVAPVLAALLVLAAEPRRAELLGAVVAVAAGVALCAARSLRGGGAARAAVGPGVLRGPVR